MTVGRPAMTTGVVGQAGPTVLSVTVTVTGGLPAAIVSAGGMTAGLRVGVVTTEPSPSGSRSCPRTSR
ncbi:hypothetical protein AHOG_19025 [Actinoalloteichus hoggarensis]|uniref:Uncharacterized protein n=1 Tax=Actinoalloteichus hoggarensis TaxID=1470176 RepID=A0A221W683_9PSEU|nr:hypothetical protein AHOG_19025 [Actinoalloteichus hoggarensis]